jgi:predicted ATP-grasp superfamily ATP-dependent carboligase
LLQACGYRGLAEVEFKQDKATGKFQLIEVNPRHWDQHELGRLVGVNLTWAAYSDMIDAAASRQVPIYNGRKCRWIAESEAFMLIARNTYLAGRAIHRQRGLPLTGKFIAYAGALRRAMAESVFLLRGRKIFATFNRRDPLPGFALCFRSARDMLSRYL